MDNLRKKLEALSDDDALRLVGQLRPQLFAQVATLRAEHLKGAGEVSDKTKDSYSGDSRRVSKQGGDPMTLSGTKASFRKLQHACIWHTREQLKETLARADRARKGKNGSELAALAVYHDELPAIEARLEFLTGCKFDPEKAVRRHKTKQQRSKLGRLPDDWLLRMHQRTRDGKYGHAVAVGSLIPVRPAEIAQRVHVWIDPDGALAFEVQGAKVKEKGSGVAKHVEGIGQPLRTLRLVDVDESRRVMFDYLRAAVIAAGGALVVGKNMTAGSISSAVCSASAREFVGFASPPSFYALRHAVSAEIKAADDSTPQLVAKAMGHASERSQQAYGMASQGNGGYVIEAKAARPVRPARPKTAPPRKKPPLVTAKGLPRGAPRPRGLA